MEASLTSLETSAHALFSQYPMRNFIAFRALGSCQLEVPMISGSVLDLFLKQKLNCSSRLTNNIQSISTQGALLILKSAFGTTHILHFLRCSLCVGYSVL